MLEIFPDNIFVPKYLFFAQGTEGDCWLLASIISLFHGGYDFTKLVQQNKKGDFLIKLFGVDNTYTIEQETFKNYPQLSHGSEAIKAIEIGVMKHMQKYLKIKELIYTPNHSIDTMYQTGISFSEIGTLYGNYAAFAFYILAGIKGNYHEINEEEEYCRYCIGNIDDYYMTISTPSKIPNSPLCPHHEYAVVGKYNNKLKIINPYNSLLTILVDIAELKKCNACFFIAERKQTLVEKLKLLYNEIIIEGRKKYYETIIDYFYKLKMA